MNLIFTLLLLGVSYFGADVKGMINKFEDIKIETYDNKNIIFPKKLLQYVPVIKELAELGHTEIPFTLKEFCTEKNFQLLIELFSHRIFKNFLKDTAKKNFCHLALNQFFATKIRPNNKPYTGNELCDLIFISDFLCINRDICVPIIEFLNKVDLRLIDSKNLIETNHIPFPSFKNNPPLFKEIILKKNEEPSLKVCFDSLTKECIFIKKKECISIKKYITIRSNPKSYLVITSFVNNETITKSIEIPAKGEPVSFDFEKNNNIIACAFNNEILIYKKNSPVLDLIEKISIDEKLNFYLKILFSPDGKKLAIKVNNKIQMYETDKYTLHDTINATGEAEFTFNNQGNQFAWSDPRGKFNRYELGKDNKFQSKKELDLKFCFQKTLFVDKDKYIYLATRNSNNVIIDLEKNITTHPSSIPFTTYDPTQNMIAYATAYSTIKFSPANDFINDIEENSTDSNINNYDNFMFSSDGDFLIKVKGQINSISIYHVPTFDRNFKGLDNSQKWFILLCDSCKQDDLPIPQNEHYNNLYETLPEVLKTKFQDSLFINWTKKKEQIRESLRKKQENDKKMFASFWQKSLKRKNNILDLKKRLPFINSLHTEPMKLRIKEK